MNQSLYELLEELEEYFDQRADILDPDGETGIAPPNRELILREKIREHLQPVKDEEE